MATHVELLTQICLLGVSFASYAVAVADEDYFDGELLASLSEMDNALLFALVPKEHAALRALFFSAAGEVDSGSSDGDDDNAAMQNAQAEGGEDGGSDDGEDDSGLHISELLLQEESNIESPHLSEKPAGMKRPLRELMCDKCKANGKVRYLCKWYSDTYKCPEGCVYRDGSPPQKKKYIYTGTTVRGV